MIRRCAAFTLFEVLVSIAIFMLLAGGIFASVRAAFVASSQVVDQQLDSERQEAFQQFLRKAFVSLPSDARVELRNRQQPGRGAVVEVLLWPIPGFMQFGTNASDGAAISAQPDGAGGYRIMLGYFRASDSVEERDRRLDRETKWLTLLTGVKQIRWRFAPNRNPVYVDVWKATSGRPGLAELSLDMNNGYGGVDQFWIPPLQRRSGGGLESGGPLGGGDGGDQPPPASGQPPVDGNAGPSEEGK